MSSITYDEVFSRFFTKVEAYDIFNENLDVDMQMELLCSWLHSAVSDMYFRRLFNTFVITDEDVVDEETEEILYHAKTITYEMKREVDETTDKDFVLEVLAYGMALAWIEPKINSVLNISQMFGSSDEKWYAQANHVSQLRNMRDDISIKHRNMIRDRGYIWNDYLDGYAASATMRSQS